MNVLIIINGVVVNVICSTDLATAQAAYPGATCIEQPPGVGPLFTYNGTTFTPPPDAS